MLHARSPLECNLYMSLHPCDCGESDFTWSTHETQERDGGLLSTYHGRCPRCGTPRRFTFATTGERVPPPAYGGPAPSQIIDPGEFFLVAQRTAAAAAFPPDPTPDEVDDAGAAAEDALAALDEVLRFIPPDSDAVPADAFTSDAGRAVYAADPTRFERGRLLTLRDRYRENLPAGWDS